MGIFRPLRESARQAKILIWTHLWPPKTKELSDLYDTLFRTADLILRKYNPCGFSSAKGCRNGAYCCEPCDHLGSRGCAVKSLPCKLWLCHAARHWSPECAASLDALEVIARSYGLIGYAKETKKQILRKAVVWNTPYLRPIVW